MKDWLNLIGWGAVIIQAILLIAMICFMFYGLTEIVPIVMIAILGVSVITMPIRVICELSESEGKE